MRTGLPVPFLLLAVALLSACAAQPPGRSLAMSTQGTTLVRVATVTDVRDVSVYGGRSSGGVASLVGAVLGGIAGSQIGSGTGSTIAGIGGSVAGSMAGQRMAQTGVVRKATELAVRFENGEVRTFQVEPGETFQAGDTVRVITQQGMTRITH